MQTNRQPTNRFLRILRYTHALFGGVILLAAMLVLTNEYILTVFRVDGVSMRPTFSNSELIPVCIACAQLGHLEKGQIIIVVFPGDSHFRFVKRIVAVPGDTVQYAGSERTLGAGQYFVEGDNRAESIDSRNYGPIAQAQILGLVLGSHPIPPGTQ